MKIKQIKLKPTCICIRIRKCPEFCYKYHFLASISVNSSNSIYNDDKRSTHCNTPCFEYIDCCSGFNRGELSWEDQATTNAILSHVLIKVRECSWNYRPRTTTRAKATSLTSATLLPTTWEVGWGMPMHWDTWICESTTRRRMGCSTHETLVARSPKTAQDLQFRT